MKIPYGIHDFKTIKTEGYLFIDKTGFIEKLENSSKYLVLLRPRRFGKSLYTSILYYYYDIKSAGIFESLFRDTYIGKNKTKEANSYYILKFDFSGINAEEDRIRMSFFRKVKVCAEKFIDYYNFNIHMEPDIKDANEYLENFLQKISSKTDKQIYIIIDEYDYFANNVLTTDLDFFNRMIGKDGFVRAFYEVLKTYAGTVIGRIFITGVTPITLDSLTSGFNMAKNISKQEALNEIMGFTESEVLDVLEKLDIVGEHLVTLKENYNGYLFSEDANVKVYNSNMVLYYLDNMVLYGKPPKNLTDSNIISDYTKITGMFGLYKDREVKKTIIHNILGSETITAAIADKFNVKLTFSKAQFLSLMYYLGLLTIDGSYGSETALKTPNYIIKNVYFEYYYHYLNEELKIHVDTQHIKDAIRELSMYNDARPFLRLVERFLKEISNRDFIRFDERYIKLLMITYFRLANLYLVKSEYEIGEGYIDIALLPNRVFEVNHYFIFEVKYISSKNDSEKMRVSKRIEAMEQIGRYAGSLELMRLPNLKKYIFVFVHDECTVLEEVDV